jgi:hypothetical protein
MKSVAAKLFLGAIVVAFVPTIAHAERRYSHRDYGYREHEYHEHEYRGHDYHDYDRGHSHFGFSFGFGYASPSYDSYYAPRYYSPGYYDSYVPSYSHRYDDCDDYVVRRYYYAPYRPYYYDGPRYYGGIHYYSR